MIDEFGIDVGVILIFIDSSLEVELLIGGNRESENRVDLHTHGPRHPSST